MILHVDLDAFFAAVEMRDDPALRGRAVVVGADPKGGRGRGVVAAASYEARAFGIHSAMPISRAYRRCPHAAFVRPRMDRYVAESRRFLEILGRYTPTVEPVSIDEAFLDVTASRTLHGDGVTIARRIKDAVNREQGLTASIGVAATKFVAKIASDLHKPDGLVVVPEDETGAFLGALPMARLWGAGPQARARFERLGLRTIGDVAALAPERLMATFGETLGRHFHDLARGIDPRQVVPDRARQSIGRETTFADDVTDRTVVAQRLFELLEDATHRLRRAGLAARTVTVKFRQADFTTVTRRETLGEPADTTEAMWPAVSRLLHKADATDQAVRLVGVSVSGFTASDQLGLFDDPARGRRTRLARAIDAVTARFGPQAIRRGVPVTTPASRRR